MTTIQMIEQPDGKVEVRYNGHRWAMADDAVHASQLAQGLREDGIEAWGEDPADWAPPEDPFDG